MGTFIPGVKPNHRQPVIIVPCGHEKTCEICVQEDEILQDQNQEQVYCHLSLLSSKILIDVLLGNENSHVYQPI